MWMLQMTSDFIYMHDWADLGERMQLLYNDQCLLINKNTIQLIWNCSHETISSPKYVCLSLQI